MDVVRFEDDQDNTVPSTISESVQPTPDPEPQPAPPPVAPQTVSTTVSSGVQFQSSTPKSDTLSQWNTANTFVQNLKSQGANRATYKPLDSTLKIFMGDTPLDISELGKEADIVDVPNEIAVNMMKDEWSNWHDDRLFQEKQKILYKAAGQDVRFPELPEPIRRVRTPDGTIHQLDDIRTDRAKKYENYLIRDGLTPELIKQQNILTFDGIVPEELQDHPKSIYDSRPQQIQEAFNAVDANRRKIITAHDTWEIEMIKRKINDENGVKNTTPASPEPERWIPARYKNEDLSQYNWETKTENGQKYHAISLSQTITNDLNKIDDSRIWGNTGGKLSRYGGESLEDIIRRNPNLSAEAIRYNFLPWDRNPETNAETRKRQEEFQTKWGIQNPQQASDMAYLSDRISSLLGEKFDPKEAIKLLETNNNTTPVNPAVSKHPLFPDQTANPIPDTPRESLGPSFEDFAAAPSHGYFSQSNDAMYLVNRGPQAPAGAINRMSDQLQRYRDEIKNETGVDVLKGLDPDAVARSSLGVAGNLGLTPMEALQNYTNSNPLTLAANAVIKGVPETLDELIHPAGLPSFDGAREFESRIAEAKRANPDSKFSIKTLEQLNKESTDYYNQKAQQYNKSNERGDLLTSLGSIGGTIAGFLSDPINLMTSAISFGAGLLRTVSANAVQQAVVSTPGTIEGQKQGVEGSSWQDWAMNVGMAGLLGAVGPAFHIADKTIQQSIKPFLGKLLENRIGENQITDWLSKGVKGAAQAADHSSQVLDTLAETLHETNPEAAVHLQATATGMKNTARFMADNPLGDSAEATLMHNELLQKTMKSITEDDFPNYLPDNVEHHMSPGEVNKVFPELSKEDSEILSQEVNKRVKNPNMIIPTDAPYGTEYVDRQAYNLKEVGSDIDQALESLTSPFSEKPVTRLSTPSGNYIPVVEKSGRVKVFESLSDAQAAISKMDVSGEKARTFIGSSPDGKFTLVRDTPVKEVGRAASYEEASTLLRGMTEKGLHINEEPKVIKFGDNDYRLLTNTDDQSLKTILDNPTFTKLNASRKSDLLSVSTPPSQAQANLDQLVASEAARLKRALSQDDEAIRDMFIHNASDLPDTFSYQDPVFGEINKGNAALKWENIKKVIQQVHDCAGM